MITEVREKTQIVSVEIRMSGREAKALIDALDLHLIKGGEPPILYDLYHALIHAISGKDVA